VSRAELARRQAELVAALTDGRPAPAGFDRRHLRSAAASLRGKRARAIARTWPRLARSLGPAFEAALERHVRERPAPHPSGALGDGRALARALAAEGGLPWEARLELLAVELRHRWPADGRRLHRRVGAAVAWRWRPATLVVAVRLPVAGERWLHVLLAHRPRVLLG
jgi:hypothetical protein